MLNKYLEDDFDSRLEEKDIEEFFEKMKKNSLTDKPEIHPTVLTVGVSKHFKSLTFMDSNRAKTKAVQEYLAMQLYEQFDDVRKCNHKVLLRFTTCTTMEAVGEINIMLKKAEFNPISEENCIESKRSENNDPDWFDDYDFVFRTNIFGARKDIEKKLDAVCLDYEFERN